MKRCPECHSSFPDTDQFCELDGTTLVAEYSDSNLVAGDWTEQELRAVLVADARNHRRRENWQTLALVTVAAVAIGLVLFLVYQGMTREAQDSFNEPSTNMAIAQQQLPLPPLRSVPIASASPSSEPSPSPSSMSSPAVQAESARAALSSSPVSTGGDEKTRRGQVTIRLTNGTTVEADEAWETGEGIWYRRRGVVTLLERGQVKAIERAIEKASPPASSTTATPTSSPTSSP
jgi:cytoskeletal protein RodZ